MRTTSNFIDTCDQEIETLIRALEMDPEAPPDASSADADRAGEATVEGEAPPSPSTPEPEPFILRLHLTRLFGTDMTLIPGIGESTALTLFAEVGANLSRFPDAAHFASWLNLCPNNETPAARSSVRRPDLAPIAPLRRCAWQPGRCIRTTPRSEITLVIIQLANHVY